MKKILILILLLMITKCYSQDVLINYYVQKQDTTGHFNDTTDMSKFAFFKFAIVSDSNIEYTFTGFNSTTDSAMVKGSTESYTTPDWYSGTIFNKLIVRKQSTASGATKYRLWIWGRKKS